jgi:hypothetical protein
MTECQVLRVQSGPSLKAAAKREEQGSEEYEHSLAPTTPRRKFNALNEHGFLGRDTIPWVKSRTTGDGILTEMLRSLRVVTARSRTYK